MLSAGLSYYLRADLANTDADVARDKGLSNQWEMCFRTQMGQNYKPVTEGNIIASLVSAGKEAVLQWEYRPIFVCGKPIEVITDVIINFTLDEHVPGKSTEPANSAGQLSETAPPQN